ncbi:methyltransferase family protein [Streptomyces sp. NPDC002573]|uniref:methyltransferase family protein n=1 Tax=Streptomyces sp. NPDC002573 TaxID=3364651 RepID=UPI0036A60D02
MIGFLLQWPTIPTLIMFPVLVYVYARLARSEDREVAAWFGGQGTVYAARTPAFWPKLRQRPPDASRPQGGARGPHEPAVRS